MKQIANVEYFYLKCNELLKTSYNVNNWGGLNNINKTINIEWVTLATQKVYLDIHKPKIGCSLLLSKNYFNNINKLVVNKELIDDVILYLTNTNKDCKVDCPCSTNMNCNCVCTGR